MHTATIVTLAAVGLVVAAPTPAAAGPTTTVNLRVSGCEGCVFIAHNGATWGGAWRKVDVSAPVANGRTRVTVPRSMTRTMSLEVQHPEGLAVPGAVAFVAFSWKKQYGYMRGGICWGKQAGARAKLRIAASTFRSREYPDQPISTFIRVRLASLPPKAQAGVNGSPGCPDLAR